MLLKRQDPYQLVLGMIGAKLGDRVLQIGCPHGGRAAAIAGKVGLSGRAIVIAPDAASAERANKGGANAGVLIEVETGSPTKLPLVDESVDVSVVDDTGGLLDSLSPQDRAATIGEIQRVLRRGGRVMLIGARPRSGLAGLLRRAEESRSFSGDALKALLSEAFVAVRVLAEREGLVFVEGVKPRQL